MEQVTSIICFSFPQSFNQICNYLEFFWIESFYRFLLS